MNQVKREGAAVVKVAQQQQAPHTGHAHAVPLTVKLGALFPDFEKAPKRKGK